MLYLAISSFVLAAILGVILLMHLFQNKTSSTYVILLHGVFAVLGILFVIGHTLENNLNDPWLILSMLILAALGGIALFTMKLKKKTIPKAMALVHPLIAGIAVLGLIIYLLD